MTEGFLEGEVAIVTGGTAGIGKEIARTFAAHGARVAVFGSNAERGTQALEDLQAAVASDMVAFFQVDVSDMAAVDVAIKEVIATFGTPSILVNNAGMTKDSLLLKMKEDDWDRVLGVNLKSCFNTAKALVRPMMKARRGKIINISSVVGLQGNAGQANYAASKAGMIGLTKSLARELAPRNICVNSIAPGYIETAMTDELNAQQAEAILASIPLGRMGKPSDIAAAALYLAASSGDYITGQTLVVDGGMVM